MTSPQSWALNIWRVQKFPSMNYLPCSSKICAKIGKWMAPSNEQQNITDPVTVSMRPFKPRNSTSGVMKSTDCPNLQKNLQRRQPQYVLAMKSVSQFYSGGRLEVQSVAQLKRKTCSNFNNQKIMQTVKKKCSMKHYMPHPWSMYEHKTIVTRETFT